jgi:hypothetical protein
MSSDRSDRFFARLIAPMLAQLKRIAGSTHGEQSVDDLKSEAWMAARELSDDQDVDFEPEDETLQQAVLSKLRKSFGRFTNRKLTFAVRLDQERIGDDGDFLPNSVAAGLTGPQGYQPEIALDLSEDHARRARLLNERFAEATAYLYIFDHFDHDDLAVASHLGISTNVLRARLGWAEIMAERQRSLFDGTETVPRNFVPLAGRARVVARTDSGQWNSICLWTKRGQLRLFSRGPALFRGRG